ncbi:MAG TPA: RHS repeat-associated core domain-containing protein, partial [Bryobacteraceae bacterium]|nr:RHS repeat-associated core domain-containing protein [Bryobacteraceae bacterium]
QTNYRTAALGYAADGEPRQKFTGKERDAETGLDYFGARYMSAAQGRFTSPDPFNAVDELGGQTFEDYLANPQYWNKYAYSLNNPLKYKDSDGHLPHAVVGALVGGGVGIAPMVFLAEYL